MSDKRLIVESYVKAVLKAMTGLKVVSSEAVDWIEKRVENAMADCATRGRRTPGGRLMAPENNASASAPVVIRQPDPAPDGRKLPERLDARAKEFAALPPEQQAEHLHKLYVQAPAINQEAIDLLSKIIVGLDPAFHPLAARATEIIRAAKELQP